MENGKDLHPGDFVVYRDRDQIQWGPWEVTEVRGEQVTMVVENLVHCSAKVNVLEKVIPVVARV